MCLVYPYFKSFDNKWGEKNEEGTDILNYELVVCHNQRIMKNNAFTRGCDIQIPSIAIFLFLFLFLVINPKPSTHLHNLLFYFYASPCF